jgi:hypothetical protein
MLVLAFAAAIAVGFLARRGLAALALLGAASLGAIVVWRLRDVRSRRADRVGRERPERRSEALEPPMVAPTMFPVTTGFLTFHDFDREKKRFNHW